MDALTARAILPSVLMLCVPDDPVRVTGVYEALPLRPPTSASGIPLAARDAGLLLVTGTLTITGTPSFNGVILVIGQGQLVYKGSGTATINGGLLVANLYNSSGSLLPPSSNPGVPNFTWSGAGHLTLNYDSCWITNLSGRVALRVLASHEEVY